MAAVAPGTPGLVSGELYVRSTPALFYRPSDAPAAEEEEEEQQLQEMGRSSRRVQVVLEDSRERCSEAMLAHLSPEFSGLLLKGSTSASSSSRSSSSSSSSSTSRERDRVESIRAARSALRAKREYRVKSLRALRGMLETQVKGMLSDVKAAQVRREARTEESMERLDEQLVSLVLRGGLAMEEEQRIVEAQRRSADLQCRQEMEYLRLAERMELFALHLSHETRGAVVLHRLPASHQQHVRCRKAATENVKAKYFESDKRYCGIKVEDVYRIENQGILAKFQKVAQQANTPGRAVKGLFCTVPDGALEHVVMYGMGKRGPLEEEEEDLGRQSLMDSGAGVSQVVTTTFLKTLHANTRPIPFPRSFSRHSTLHQENMRGGAAGVGSEKEAGADSGVRFLALCRVVMPRMYISDEPWARHPAQGQGQGQPLNEEEGEDDGGFAGLSQQAAALLVAKGAYDSVYSQELDEYGLLKEDHVMPEFLVAYRFKARPGSTACPTPVIVHDFSTPSLPLCWLPRQNDSSRRPISSAAAAAAGGGGGGGARGLVHSQQKLAAADVDAEASEEVLQQARQNAAHQRRSLMVVADSLFACHVQEQHHIHDTEIARMKGWVADRA